MRLTVALSSCDEDADGTRTVLTLSRCPDLKYLCIDTKTFDDIHEQLILPFKLDRLVIGGIYDEMCCSVFLYSALFESSPRRIDFDIELHERHNRRMNIAHILAQTETPIYTKHLSLYADLTFEGDESEGEISTYFLPLLSRLTRLETIETDLEGEANVELFAAIESYDNLRRIEMSRPRFSFHERSEYTFNAERDLLQSGRLKRCPNVEFCIERRGMPSGRTSVKQSCQARKIKLVWMSRSGTIFCGFLRLGLT